MRPRTSPSVRVGRVNPVRYSHHAVRGNEAGHRLHVMCLRKCVEGAEFPDPIALVDEVSEIARKASYVTPDMHHDARIGRRHGTHHVPSRTGTRRIENNHVRSRKRVQHRRHIAPIQVDPIVAAEGPLGRLDRVARTVDDVNRLR